MTVTGLQLKDRSSTSAGEGVFLFTTGSKTIMGSAQCLIQWVCGNWRRSVRPERKSDHSPTFTAEVKNPLDLAYVFLPSYFTYPTESG